MCERVSEMIIPDDSRGEAAREVMSREGGRSQGMRETSSNGHGHISSGSLFY